MKSLLLITDIFPPDIGGPATFVKNMAATLSQKGWQVTVLTFADSGAEREEAPEGYKVVRIDNNQNKILKKLKGVLQFFLLALNHEKLFVNGFYTEYFFCGPLVRYLLGKKICSKIVGDLAWETAMLRGWIDEDFNDFQGKKHPLKIEWVKIKQRGTLSYSHKVIVPSHFLKGVVQDHWRIEKEKVEVIYNASSLKAMKVEEGENLLTTPLKLLFVGRLVSWKGVDTLIDAVEELDESIGLLIVGDGPEEERLKKRASHRIRFSGKMAHDKLQRLYSGSDAFLLDSGYEGLSHVLLEALQMGLPCIVSDRGGNGEVVEEGVNGYVVPYNDKEALKEAIQKIEKGEILRERVMAHNKNLAVKFDRVKMEGEYEALLESL